MITITDLAVEKIKQIAAENPSVQGLPLRVMAQAGCGGARYGFGFDQKKDGDTEHTIQGMTVLMDPETEKIMAGSTIDFRQDPRGEGFAISNPNVQSGGCGCESGGGCGSAESEKSGGCGEGSCGCH